MVPKKVLVCLSLLIVGGCSNPPNPFPGLPKLLVGTQFGIDNLCDTAVSPEIRLGRVPDGTASYVVQMSDTDVLIQTPWREVVPLESKTEIPAGAAKTYVGPCIGDNARFAPVAPYGYTFRVEVLAQDARGKPLAYGATYALVSSPYMTARLMRLRLQHGETATPPTRLTPYANPCAAYSSYSNPYSPYGDSTCGNANPYSALAPTPSPGYGILQ